MLRQSLLNRNFQLFAEAEIDDLEHSVVQHDVVWFQVPVDDSFGV